MAVLSSAAQVVPAPGLVVSQFMKPLSASLVSEKQCLLWFRVTLTSTGAQQGEARPPFLYPYPACNASHLLCGSAEESGDPEATRTVE